MLHSRATTPAHMPILRHAASPTPTGPLYRRVQAALTRKLAAGVWKPGEAIPSEADLAREFGLVASRGSTA